MADRWIQLGSPRSGSTWFNQMVASHPCARTAGESLTGPVSTAIDLVMRNASEVDAAQDLIFAAPDVRFVGTQRKDEPGPPMPEEGNRGIDGHASTLVKHLIFGRNTKFIVPPPLKVGSEFTTTSLWAKRRGLS